MLMEILEWQSTGSAILVWLLPVGLWCAWWLGAVNWKKTWPVLAEGGWAPLVLLMIMATMVWSRLQPVPCTCLGSVTIPNVWWQLGSVCGLVALALLCGWLQGYYDWTLQEVSLEPPASAGHGHNGHSHAHDHH
jgi:hypothetical protein